MEKVRCPEHGAVCLLKTGTREGPNKGRSFYVCPANRGQACPFTRATELPPSHCLLHDDAQLDLQALVKQDPGSYRLFYRCMKSEGKKFCGNVPWKEEPKCKVTARCDLPAEKTEKPQRNPFKVINDDPRLGTWKQVSEERKRSSEESGEVKAAENQRKNGEEKAEEIRRKSREEKADKIRTKSREEKADEIRRKNGEEKAEEIRRKNGEEKADEIRRKNGEEKADEIRRKNGEEKAAEIRTKSREEKADEIQRKNGEEKADEIRRKNGEEKAEEIRRKNGEEKADEIRRKSREEKADEIQRKNGEEKADEIRRKNGEEKAEEIRRKNGEEKADEIRRKNGEEKADEIRRKNGEEKAAEIRTKSREKIAEEIRTKSGEEAKRQEVLHPNDDRARRSLKEKTSNQGLKNIGEETRLQNNATGLSSDRGRKVCEADNGEKPGRTSEGRATTMEDRRTQPASDGGQKVVEDSEPSFQGWREKELPAGLKIKKKLPEEMVQEDGESSTVTSISPSDPREEPADDEDVVFVSSQPGKDKVTSLRTSGGGKQRTITSFPGFTPQADGPSSAAQHAILSAQLQQKKATVASVNLKALPDGGVRLLKQVQDLEDALGSLSLSSQAVIQPGRGAEMRPKPDPGNVLSRAGPAEGNRGVKPLSFHELPPSALGLQGLTTSQNYSSLYGVAPQWQSLYGGRMTEEKLFAVRNATSETIDHLHKSLESCPGPESTTEDPRGLKVPLLLHQKQALAWLQWRETQRPQGGILADDMGLGKTLTMIALILAHKQRQKSEKEEEKKLESWISKTDSTLTVSRGTLIICPASLVHHWKKEVEKRVSDGRLRVYLYHGANREKDCKMLAQYDIVVTTYSLVSKEIPAKKEEGEAPAKDQDLEDRAASSPLLRLAWTRIILDEAHNIKNPKVQTSIAVCKLRAGARWAVTGTPIQNNLLDLYSLLRFLRCSPFDEFKLWKSQVDNGSRKGGERLTILTKSLLLRRTKDQLDHMGRPLVELPQRTCEVHQLALSPQEQAVYDVIFARSRSTLQHYLRRHEGASNTASGSADNPFDRVAREFGPSQGDVSAPPLSQGSSTVHILSLLLRLRQCCSHLSLLKTTLDQLELKTEGLSLTLEEQLNALTLCDLKSPDPKSTVSLNGTSFQAELFESETGSTKIDALVSRLKTINSSSIPQKSVVVSQWTSMLRIVAVHLKRIGMSHATIDGSINPKLRMDIVEEFNTNPRGPQVMLVSLCAGGVGLNLIGGNHLFLMDMHWNPALEDQACDRIYRVGQRKDVVIHRFVCQGTVEEKISQLQEKKKDLAKKVLTGNGSTFTKLTLTDLRLLFGV